MTTYTVKCDRCKAKAEYREKPGHALYETAEVEGWSWSEKRGWSCSSCEFTRITRPIAMLPTLI